MNRQDKNKEWFALFQTAVQFTQLGLSLIVPLVLCLLAANWLQKRFGLGNWVSLIGLVLGLSTMVLTFIRFVRRVLKDTRKKK